MFLHERELHDGYFVLRLASTSFHVHRPPRLKIKLLCFIDVSNDTYMCAHSMCSMSFMWFCMLFDSLESVKGMLLIHS